MSGPGGGGGRELKTIISLLCLVPACIPSLGTYGENEIPFGGTPAAHHQPPTANHIIILRYYHVTSRLVAMFRIRIRTICQGPDTKHSP
jgi:hypothetical protein